MEKPELPADELDDVIKVMTAFLHSTLEQKAEADYSAGELIDAMARSIFMALDDLGGLDHRRAASCLAKLVLHTRAFDRVVDLVRSEMGEDHPLVKVAPTLRQHARDARNR